eukprot:COSAG02_NODE_336_length_24344_cov_63.239101_14_plen_590_part_00
MQIFVTLPRGNKLTFEVEGSDSVESLKEAVSLKHPPAHPDLQTIALRLDGDGTVTLENGKTLAEYGVRKESEFVIKLRQAAMEIALSVGGMRYSTLLETLLAKPGSRLRSMFIGLAEGAAAPSFPIRAGVATAGELPEGEPYIYAPVGPLPQDATGAYLIDRDGPSFRYILNYLRDGRVRGLPTSVAEVQQLAAEAEYYGLDELASTCTCPLPALAARCDVGVTVEDILVLSPQQRQELCKQEHINVVGTLRVEVEACLRLELAPFKLTEAGLRLLVASHQTKDTVWELDAAAATQLGLSEDDARKIGEGKVGLKLRQDLAKHYTGSSTLSEAGVRSLAVARQTLADVRRLDNLAALQLGLSADDARKVVWDGEKGMAARDALADLQLSEAGLGALIAHDLTTRKQVVEMTVVDAVRLGLSAEDARIVGESTSLRVADVEVVCQVTVSSGQSTSTRALHDVDGEWESNGRKNTHWIELSTVGVEHAGSPVYIRMIELLPARITDSYEVGSRLDIEATTLGGEALRTCEVRLPGQGKPHQTQGQGDPLVLFNADVDAGEQLAGSVRVYMKETNGTNIRISSLRVTSCAQT